LLCPVVEPLFKGFIASLSRGKSYRLPGGLPESLARYSTFCQWQAGR
jgi:hypothetical protein